MEKLLIGNLEIVHLPKLGISNLQVRIDTGAKSSSLHVDHIKTFKKGVRRWVSFDLHSDHYNTDEVIRYKAPLHKVSRVKSSNGVSQRRYVIRTPMEMNGKTWPIDITLSDRSDMTYLMLLGREGMGSRVLVDPARSFLTRPTATKKS